MSDRSKTSLILLGISLVIFSSVSPLEANSTGLVPLTELGSDMYMGYEGGLYPDGSNDLPAAHLALGQMRADEVIPRDANGNPDPNGWIVMISIGMSNTCHEFGVYERVAEGGRPCLDCRALDELWLCIETTNYRWRNKSLPAF